MDARYTRGRAWTIKNKDPVFYIYNSNQHGDDISMLLLASYIPENLCVWTSMLKCSIQMAQYFNNGEYLRQRVKCYFQEWTLNGLAKMSLLGRVMIKTPKFKRRPIVTNQTYSSPSAESELDIADPWQVSSATRCRMPKCPTSLHQKYLVRP